MTLITLHSDNPNFSYIIRKNLSTPLFHKNIQNGSIIGFYSESTSNKLNYNLTFIEGEEKGSFAPNANDFSYLSTNYMSSPMAYLSIINNALASACKEENEFDITNYNYSLCFEYIELYYLNTLDRIIQHINSNLEIDIHLEKLSDNKEKDYKSIYKLSLSSNSLTFYKVINIARLICLFGTHKRKISEYRLNKDFLIKYSKFISNMNLPYYIKYLFSKSFLYTRENFKVCKPILDNKEIKLEFGDTQLQRYLYLKELINKDSILLDIGCGEGYYLKNLNKDKHLPKEYIGIDIDPICRDRVNNSIQELGLNTSCRIFSSVEKLIKFKQSEKLENLNTPSEKVQVLLTEVIEHLNEDDSRNLIQFILQNIDFESFIITTPNSEFNRFYLLDRFRHFDHKWEKSKEEFKQYIESILESQKYSREYFDIGDKVDGLTPTQGVILKTLN